MRIQITHRKWKPLVARCKTIESLGFHRWQLYKQRKTTKDTTWNNHQELTITFSFGESICIGVPSCHLDPSSSKWECSCSISDLALLSIVGIEWLRCCWQETHDTKELSQDSKIRIPWNWGPNGFFYIEPWPTLECSKTCHNVKGKSCVLLMGLFLHAKKDNEIPLMYSIPHPKVQTKLPKKRVKFWFHLKPFSNLPEKTAAKTFRKTTTRKTGTLASSKRLTAAMNCSSVSMPGINHTHLEDPSQLVSG